MKLSWGNLGSRPAVKFLDADGVCSVSNLDDSNDRSGLSGGNGLIIFRDYWGRWSGFVFRRW